MPTLDTSYTPGGATTRTSQYAGSGGNPLTEQLREFALRRMQALRTAAPGQVVGAPAAQVQQQAATPRRVVSDDGGDDSPSRDMRLKVEQSDAEARMAENRRRVIAAITASQPAPQTFLPSGPGITGGYVSDPRAMNADQRKMFLPQDSRLVPMDHTAEASDAAKAADPLADKYSDAYRELVTKGYSPAQIEALRMSQAKGGGNNLMQGARDSAQGAGYQGANGGGHSGGRGVSGGGYGYEGGR